MLLAQDFGVNYKNYWIFRSNIQIENIINYSKNLIEMILFFYLFWISDDFRQTKQVQIFL